MDELCDLMGFQTYDVLNNKAAKAFDGQKTVIIKITTYDSGVAPYIAVQNQGGSKFVPRLFEIVHCYHNDLPKQLIESNRLDDPSLYCVQMEYIEGFHIWEYYVKQDELGIITPNSVCKLIKQTFNGLRCIHNSGYSCGDSAIANNIILQGTYNDWNRAVITNIAGGKIDKYNAINDILTLAHIIWSVIVGKISETKDNQGIPITWGNPLFIDLVKNNIAQYDEYKQYLDFLLWIFEKPRTMNKVIECAMALK